MVGGVGRVENVDGDGDVPNPVGDDDHTCGDVVGVVWGDVAGRRRPGLVAVFPDRWDVHAELDRDGFLRRTTLAFTDQAALAANSTFRDRVRVAVATAAVQIMGEAEGSYSDTHFGKRQSLAYQVLQTAASGALLEAFVWATVANAAVTDASSDSDIQFTVNSAWDDLAGVRITD